MAGLCQLSGLHSPSPGTWSGVLGEVEEWSSGCAGVNGLCAFCQHSYEGTPHLGCVCWELDVRVLGEAGKCVQGAVHPVVFRRL